MALVDVRSLCPKHMASGDVADKKSGQNDERHPPAPELAIVTKIHPAVAEIDEPTRRSVYRESEWHHAEGELAAGSHDEREERDEPDGEREQWLDG